MRSRAAWVAIVVIAMTSVADAKPRGRAARAAFDRGVTAYQKGNYIAASEALGKSFELERDVDTLFAWAQSERKLERCDKALELYERLLTFKLPPANRNAVVLKLDECRTVLAQQKPAPEPPAAFTSEPAKPFEVAPVIAPPKPVVPPPPPVIESPGVAQHARPPSEVAGSSAWYKDPIALGLLGSGVVAGGVGGALLLSARTIDSDAKSATTYEQAVSLSDKAKSRGTIGAITAGAGGALVVGGIVWVITHRTSSERSTVTGWLSSDSGGVAVSGGF